MDAKVTNVGDMTHGVEVPDNAAVLWVDEGAARAFAMLLYKDLQVTPVRGDDGDVVGLLLAPPDLKLVARPEAP